MEKEDTTTKKLVHLENFLDMVGYYTKDIDEDHFEFVYHNVSGNRWRLGCQSLSNMES
jgi:hypothetical protein